MCIHDLSINQLGEDIDKTDLFLEVKLMIEENQQQISFYQIIFVEEQMNSNSSTYFNLNKYRRRYPAQNRLEREQSRSNSVFDFRREKQNIKPINEKVNNFGVIKPFQEIQGSKSQMKVVYLRKEEKRSVVKESLQNNKIKQKLQNNSITEPVTLNTYKLKHQSSIANKRYIYNLYKGVKFLIEKLRPFPIQQVNRNCVTLYEPMNSKAKFLLLDLDQTLIFTERTPISINKNHTFKICIRPYTYQFLQKMAHYYQIYVFTAATKGYAEAAVKKLNQKKIYIKDILCRNHCIETKKGKFIKDLRIIKNRELSDIILIDNTVQSFGLQIENGIPILDFDGKTVDDQLLKLAPFLQQLSQVEDVRPYIKNKFGLSRMLQLERKQLVQFLFEKQQA